MRAIFNQENGKFKHLLCSENELWDADDQMTGVCVLCGNIEPGRCEPDATGYTCSKCGKPGLYAVAELALCQRIVIKTVGKHAKVASSKLNRAGRYTPAKEKLWTHTRN